MKCKAILTLAALGAAAAAQPLLAEGGNKKIIDVTNTQQLPFQPGGTLRLGNFDGYLSIEGWDRPEVEVTVVKTLDKLYSSQEQAEANKRADAVHVTAARKSDTEIEISAAVPHYSRWTHPFGSDGGVTLKFQIHTPRNTRLVIHHGTGDVLVSSVTAEIEARGHAGDIVLLLPEAGQYAIDAKTGIGTVSSDFAGDYHRKHWVGIHYADSASGPARRVFLRMGVGGITIKSSPPSAQPPAAAGGVQ